MNAIHLLSAQPWVERLGSTLLHFLWQGILIAALYAAHAKVDRAILRPERSLHRSPARRSPSWPPHRS